MLVVRLQNILLNLTKNEFTFLSILENYVKFGENEYSRATDNLTSTRMLSRYKQYTNRGQSPPSSCGLETKSLMSYRDRSRSSQRYQSSSRKAIDTASGMDCYSTVQSSIKSEIVDEPITIISVLSLLSTFEKFLGSLGPKMIELMTEAIKMEKLSVNSSNRLLDDNNHCLLFETMKEKLKGFLRGDLVEPKKGMEIKKTLDCMDVLIHEANARKHISSECYDRSAIAAKMLLALNEQGRKDISEKELAHYVDQYIKMANAKQSEIHELKPSTENLVEVTSVPAMDTLNTKNRDEIKANRIFMMSNPITSSTSEVNPSKLQEPTTLSDSNLRTLIKNFHILSDMEKHDVIVNVRELEINDQERMKRLRKEMDIDKLLFADFGPSKVQRDDKKLVFSLQSKRT